MASISLGDAITAVPQLRSSCTLVLNDGIMGVGIKLMRLVSKQLRTAMLGLVQGYTLDFTGSIDNLLHTMALLKDSRLSLLRVVASASTSDGFLPLGLNGWNAHSLHLSCFIHGMGPAIRGISRLEVNVPSNCSRCRDEVAVLLSQLAEACPAVQQLQITGDVGRGLLAALGASCAKLWYLEVMEGVSVDVLEELQLVLPGLKKCRVEHAHLSLLDYVQDARPLCQSLMSCSTLTSLDVGTAQLTPPMWQALPAGLKELCCWSGMMPLDDLRVLERMTAFQCMCDPATNRMYLSCLVAIVRVMPNLKVLLLSSLGLDHERGFIPGVIVPCFASTVLDLVYLHDRVVSGLQVTSQMPSKLLGESPFSGMYLSLDIDSDSDDEEETVGVLDFLSLLPPFPAFTCVGMESEFYHPIYPSFTQKIAEVFSNLTALTLELPDCISSRDLKHLGSFTALQHLLLDEAHVSPASLAMLCTRLPMLRTILLHQCVGFSVADGTSLQDALTDWGSGVKVYLS